MPLLINHLYPYAVYFFRLMRVLLSAIQTFTIIPPTEIIINHWHAKIHFCSCCILPGEVWEGRYLL